MLMINMFRAYRRKSALRSFQTNAILGGQANIHHTACCVNSGENGQITIGEHCEIKGRIECYGEGKITIGKHFYMGGVHLHHINRFYYSRRWRNCVQPCKNYG